MITEMLFESPLGLYLTLLVIEAGIAAVWLARRKRAWKLAMIAPIVLGVAIGVTARLVVTDREYVEVALAEIASGAGTGNFEPAERHMHPDCRMPIIGRGPIGRRVILNWCKSRRAQLEINSIEPFAVSTIVDGDRLITDFRTRFTPSIPTIDSIRWRLVWVPSGGVLRIHEIEIVEPRELLGRLP